MLILKYFFISLEITIVLRLRIEGTSNQEHATRCTFPVIKILEFAVYNVTYLFLSQKKHKILAKTHIFGSVTRIIW